MIFNLFKRKKNNISDTIDKELKENRSSVVSLKEYDEGKKEISTTYFKRRLPNIRTTPR